MKKFLRSVFLSGLLCSASALQALPVGNPAEPSLLLDGVVFEGFDSCDSCASFCDSISLRIGFYGDYVFDRSLKTDVEKEGFLMGPPVQTVDKDPWAVPDALIRDKADILVNNPAYNQHLHNAELCTNAAFLALNIWDRFDIFCTLGAFNGYIKGNATAFNLVGVIGDTRTLSIAKTTVDFPGDPIVSPNIFLTQSVVELYTDTAFAWSIGARAALWECENASLGAEFQYAQSKPKIETLNVLSSPAEFTINKPKGYKKGDGHWDFPLPQEAGMPDAANVKSASIDYHEWQIGLALSYRFDMLAPYIGVKFSRATLDADSIRIAQPEIRPAPDAVEKQPIPDPDHTYLKGFILSSTTWNPTILGSTTPQTFLAPEAYEVQNASLQINKMKSRKSCGLVLGTTLISDDHASVTAEVRLIDEHAAHINAQFRF